MDIKIQQATKSQMHTVHALFIEYQEWLGVDLCFQGFDEELRTLPGKYAPPKGVIYLATEGDKSIGCVAVRPLTKSEAELKRLYVRKAYRRKGIGKKLFLAAMAFARSAGFKAVVLDTLEEMTQAKALYTDYGFRQISAYYRNPESSAEYYRYEFPCQ